MSIAEAAGRLSLSPSGVARMVRDGRIPFVVIGRRTLIRSDR